MSAATAFSKSSTAYFRMPKALFTDPTCLGLSLGAKVLYVLLLDRQSLSLQNNWQDETGRVYLYFTVEEMAATLSCCRQKALSYLRELIAAGLAERKRQGHGKPSRIYVRSMTDEPSTSSPHHGDDMTVRSTSYSRHRRMNRDATEFCRTAGNKNNMNQREFYQNYIARLTEMEEREKAEKEKQIVQEAEPADPKPKPIEPWREWLSRK